MASQNDISARIATAKKEGFTDEQIYSSLASNAGFGKRISMAKKEGYSDSDIAKTLGLNLQKDLGVQQPIKGVGSSIIQLSQDQSLIKEKVSRLEEAKR